MTSMEPVAMESFVELVAAEVGDPERLRAVFDSGLLDSPTDSAFDRIAALASRLLGTPFGFITVVDDRRSFWKASVGVDITGPADRQNPVEESFCQYVVGTDGPFLVGDATEDARTRGNPSIETMGVRAWAGVPLRSPEGLVLGTVCVVDTQPRRWSDQDAQLLLDLAGIAADEIRSSQTAELHRQATAEAQHSRAVLDAILERAPVGFCLFDSDMRYEMINSAMAAINGHAAEDHIGRSISDIVPDMADDLLAMVRQVLVSGDAIGDIEIRGETAASPGEERIWSASYFPIDDGSQPRGVAMLVSDITDRVLARERAQRLAAITRRLGGAETLDGVADILAEDGPAYLVADVVAIAVLDDAGAAVEMIGELGRSDGQARFDIAENTPYAMAVRERRTVLVTGQADRRARFSDGAERAEARGYGASASLPLFGVGGDVFGVLVTGWRHDLSDPAFPGPQLHALADVAAQTMERARTAAQRRELLNSLQSSLLPTQDRVGGIEVAQRYVPATDAIGFGGDWYDLVELADGNIAIVVGDVVGHDPTAAARMAEIRTTVATLIRLGTGTDDLMASAGRLLDRGRGELLATVGVTVVDTGRHEIRTVLAGHPPPLLLAPDGTVSIVPHQLNPPLGMEQKAAGAPTGRYEPGSVFVAYTDGLVESRREPLHEGVERLVAALGGLTGLSAEEVADRLVPAPVAGAEQGDDIVVVVARL